MKKYIYIFVCLILFSLSTKSVHASWWNDGWKYRKQLTFQNSAQNENLNNFPVLVKLTASNFDFSKAQSTGYDMRFLDSNDNTELPYEIEKWDAAAQEAIVWVKVPQIDASTNSDYMYMYYGNSVAVNAQSTISVWNNYLAVYHFDEEAAGTGTTSLYKDQTSNYYAGDDFVSDTNKTGIIGNGVEFDGTDDYIKLPTQLNVTLPLTLSMWVYPQNTTAAMTIFSSDRDVGTGITFQSGNKFAFRIKTANNGNSTNIISNGVALNNWYHLVWVYDGATLKGYVNGIKEIDVVRTGAIAYRNGGTTNEYCIGCYITGATKNSFWGFKIDQFEAIQTNRSESWVAADYKSQNNTFVNYSTEDTNIHSDAYTQYVSQSSTEKPNCTNTAPAAPDLFQINTTKNSATLYFTPAGNPHNSYTISYGYDDNVERFGTGFSKQSTDGVQSYTINALSPSTKYFFKIKASNGCMPGLWSRTMTVKTNNLYGSLGFIYYAYSSFVKTIKTAF